jgi:hypothetical protein
MGQPEWDSQTRAARTRQPEQDSQNKKDRRGQAKLYRRNITGRTDRQNVIGRTGQAEWDR